MCIYKTKILMISSLMLLLMITSEINAQTTVKIIGKVAAGYYIYYEQSNLSGDVMMGKFVIIK